MKEIGAKRMRPSALLGFANAFFISGKRKYYFFPDCYNIYKSPEVIVVTITSVMCERGPFCVTNIVCPRFRMRSNLIFEESRLIGRIITHKVTVKSVKNYNNIDLNFL